MPLESTTTPKQPSSVLLIVLIVLGGIALLAFLFLAFATMFVLPRMVKTGREAHEATLKTNIVQIRAAIDRFKADTGYYPVELTDLVLPENVAPTHGIDARGRRILLPAGSYRGPYLTVSDGIGGIPVNPFNKPTESSVSDHWRYKNGVVHPAGPKGKTLDGIPYSDL